MIALDLDEDEQVALAIAASREVSDRIFAMSMSKVGNHHSSSQQNQKRRKEEHAGDLDFALKMSHQELEAQRRSNKYNSDDELNRAIAQSIEANDMIQNGFWCCRFCSCYSNGDYCSTCNSPKGDEQQEKDDNQRQLERHERYLEDQRQHQEQQQQLRQQQQLKQQHEQQLILIHQQQMQEKQAQKQQQRLQQQQRQEQQQHQQRQEQQQREQLQQQLRDLQQQLAKAQEVPPPQPKRNPCGLPGCNILAVHFGFCTPNHLSRARSKGLLPPSEEGVDRVIVGPTGDFSIQLLTKKHPEHAIVKQQFLDAWLKKEAGRPRVMRVYKIQNSPHIFTAYQHMETALGNSHPRFHGTSQHSECTFGSNQSTPPCERADCRVCSICQKSFSIEKAGELAGQRMDLRYGKGLYFSATSSKSHDYNEGSERLLRTGEWQNREWRWRAIFLCSVVIGKSFETQLGELPLEQCPPPGYDSVSGVVGAALNFDEVVVYDNNQAIPSFLVIYSIPP